MSEGEGRRGVDQMTTIMVVVIVRPHLFSARRRGGGGSGGLSPRLLCRGRGGAW
jgi:hypothetical protein